MIIKLYKVICYAMYISLSIVAMYWAYQGEYARAAFDIGLAIWFKPDEIDFPEKTANLDGSKSDRT